MAERGRGKFGGNNWKGSNRDNPYHVPRSHRQAILMSFDRYCTDCGLIIEGQALKKSGHCGSCQVMISHRGSWSAAQIGRCPDCDSLIKESDFFCSLCRYENTTNTEKRKRIRIAEQQKAALDKKMALQNIVEENAAKDALIAQLRSQLDQQEIEIFCNRTEKFDLQAKANSVAKTQSETQERANSSDGVGNSPQNENVFGVERSTLKTTWATPE